jgi:hypothetical protein
MYQEKWIYCVAIVVRKQKRGRLGGAQVTEFWHSRKWQCWALVICR